MGRALEEIIRNLFWLVLCVLALLVITAPLGCQTLDPATKAAIQQIQDQSKTALAKAQAAADLAAQNAKNNPTGHPLGAGNQVVVEVHKPLLAATGISTLAFLVGLGLWVASKFAATLGTLFYGLASIIAPIGGTVAGGCWTLIFLLPWWPWILLSVALGVVGIVVYHLHENGWSITALFHVTGTTPAAAKAAVKAGPKVTITGP